MKEYKNTTKTKMNLFSRIADSIYQQGYEDGQAATPFTDTEEVEEKAYNRGLAEAWEVAGKITNTVIDGGYSLDELQKIFGESSLRHIFKHNTATEAIAKIKEYEDKQKQDAEIKVGDEVYSEEDELTFIVTRIKGTEYEGICTDGACYNGLPDDIVKTGRHFDAIAEVLAELRGAEQ